MRKMRRNVLGSMLLRGYFPWEGATSATEMLYLARTARHANAGLVGETGFSTGFSSRAFLQAHPDARVVSFDLCENRWTGIAKELIDKQFPGRHTLIRGDSRDAVPKFRANNPELRFDLVFIDGGHSYEVAKADLLNMRELSSENTAVIMDDLVPRFAYGVGPTRASNDAIAEGILRQDKVFKDGRMRSWDLGQYVS
jgi:predicted O-methyltransferase YrrM